MAGPDVVVLRQQGSVLAGWVGILLLGGLLVGLVLSGSLWSSLGATLVLVLMLASTWVLVVRPSLALGPSGVVLHNPFRTTHLPWGLIESTGTQWMLEVHTSQRRYASWAIGSGPTRPSRLTARSRSSPWDVDHNPHEAVVQAGRVTATSAAQLIDERRQAHAAAPDRDPQTLSVRTEWNRLALTMVGLPAVLLVLRLVF